MSPQSAHCHRSRSKPENKSKVYTHDAIEAIPMTCLQLVIGETKTKKSQNSHRNILLSGALSEVQDGQPHFDITDLDLSLT